MNEQAEQHKVGPRRLRKAKRDLLRAAIIILTTSTAMVFFVVWYKAWPQRLDCYRQSLRLASALDHYYTAYRKLPPVLNMLELKSGRYHIGHYKYQFEGFGYVGRLRDGMVIAYCRVPHTGLFRAPGRHILIYREGKIIVVWLPEKEFQTLIRSQPDPSKLWY